MLGLESSLTFGKFKGKTVREVIQSDFGYVKWLRDQRHENGENLLTPEADVALQMKTGKLKARITSASEAAEKSRAAVEKAAKIAAAKANEAREQEEARE